VATLSEIEAADAERQPTGIDELDRALGGGLVAGGVVLIGGDPGIGKSTLLLQALESLSRAAKVLYVTGEESGAQVALRSRRLGLAGSAVRVMARSSSRRSWRRSRPSGRRSASSTRSRPSTARR
jgi:DNA repair protein RadA/Sms